MRSLEFHLDHFDGPMDLLMHLIEKSKLDIYDIPINELTEQYLEYLEDAQSMNLEIASHFLLFAAQLIRIKVKMLLPTRRDQQETEDPRQSLVDQIVAYRFFKDLSENLQVLHEQCADYYPRKVDIKMLVDKQKKLELPRGLDPHMLSSVFEVLEACNEEKTRVMVIEKLNFSIADLKKSLLNFCNVSQCPTFQNILRNCTSSEEMVAFFFALLECIRQNEIVAVQHEIFGDIWLRTQAS